MKAYLLLVILTVGQPLFSETFFVVSEETRNGEPQPLPHPSKEGLLSALFEQGHIVFDDGSGQMSLSWEELEFSQPLNGARRGGARLLIAARVQSQVHQATASPSPLKGNTVEAQAQYFLLDVASSTLIDRGELVLDNRGREKELPYAGLLFHLGEEIIDRVLALGEQTGTAGSQTE